MKKYQIFADEAWTHKSKPLTRYHNFFGGILGTEADIDRLDTKLRHIINKHEHKGEVKWSKLNTKNQHVYLELVNSFFDAIQIQDSLKYRQMFLDRSFIYTPRENDDKLSDLDIQFKLCYQFLKHAFGLKHLTNENTELLIRFDTHSSQIHRDNLIQFVEKLPIILDKPNINIRLTFVDSSKFLQIQICDLIMGAAGSYGNKMHKRRYNGNKKQTPKQRLKYHFAKVVYDRIREINCNQRNKKAFNWFESTGLDANNTNMLNHKIRIWKFVPQRYRINKGWHNDHLSAEGLFIANDIDNTIYDPSEHFI